MISMATASYCLHHYTYPTIVLMDVYIVPIIGKTKKFLERR